MTLGVFLRTFGLLAGSLTPLPPVGLSAWTIPVKPDIVHG
jgi:hypothetical protein